MRLPGGIATSAGLERSFAWQPLDGAIELAVFEALEQPAGWSRQVTAALAAALATVGGQTATPDRVRDLAVGDRQFLLRQLGIRLHGDEHWRTETCRACAERFDLCVRHSTLPVKEAGHEFPHARVAMEKDAEPIQFRVPTGRDQEALEDMPEGTDPRAFLARRLVVGGETPGAGFDATQLSAIEAAIEAVAPEVTTVGQARCPHCGEETTFPIEPGSLLFRHGSEHLTEEVHRIALYYHWSESEILGLPRARRVRYLDLIDRSRGVQTAEPSVHTEISG